MSFTDFVVISVDQEHVIVESSYIDTDIYLGNDAMWKRMFLANHHVIVKATCLRYIEGFLEK